MQDRNVGSSRLSYTHKLCIAHQKLLTDFVPGGREDVDLIWYELDFQYRLPYEFDYLRSILANRLP